MKIYWTKRSVYIRREFISHRICLEHVSAGFGTLIPLATLCPRNLVTLFFFSISQNIFSKNIEAEVCEI